MIKRIAVSIGTAALALVAAVSARAQSYSNAVQALNPVAYWPLAESTAPGSLYVATNSGTLGAAGNGYYETWWQTNGNPGLLTNGNSIVHIAGAITGDSDTAMQQGAVGQYVVIPRTTNGVFNPGVTLTAPFSIEAWVFPTNGTANQLKPILVEGFNTVLATNLNNDIAPVATYGGASIGMFSSFIYFNTFNFGTKNEIDTATLPLNKWYHIVATFDGTTMRLYTNGVQVATKAPAANAFGQRYTPDLVSPLIIGGGNELGISGGANVEFGGGIDEVAIYNSVLSQAQVTSHFTTGTNASRATPYAQVVQGDSPAIYLRLDEPSFTGPALAASPVANNYGSLGVSANGFYLPGTTPGIAGPPYTGFGSSSLGVALNGFNAGVDVGGGALPAQLNPTGNQPMSVAAWFRGNPSDAVGRFQEIVGHSDSGWRFGFDNNDGTRFNPGNGPELQFSSVNDVLLSGAFVNDGNWHFIAGVSDGTNDSLYIDGLLVKTGTSVGAVTGSTQDVILGGDPQYLAPQPLSIGGGGRWFDGSLAQVAFFTNALSGSQLAGIYNAAGVPPAIRVQPSSQNLFSGNNASIPAIAIGSGPLSYQWYTTGNSPVSGQNTSALTFTPATAGNAGSYYLMVANTFGAVTSSVVQVTVAGAAQQTPYASAIHQLNPVAYWPLNETTQPPAGQYIATNSGTAGAAGNAYYGSWYQPVTIGSTNTYFATNSIIHSAGATGDGDADMLCVNTAAGAGQYVVLPRFTNGVANPAASITGAFSIEAWLKTTNMASNLKPAVTEGRNQNQSGASQQFTNNEYGFSLGQFTNFFYFQVYDGQHQANSGQPQIQISNLQSNVWYHVVVTYDGTTETIYSNGIPIQSAAATYAPDPVSPLIIGSGTDVPTQTGGQEFSGEIDDVAIYNTALSAAQVANHFAAVGPGYSAAVQADSPTLYYRLDEPAFNSYPSPSTYPVAVNYGSAGAAANGAYMPGTTPGVAGPSFAGFGSSTAVAFNGFYGGVDIGGGLTPTVLNPLGTQPETVVAWFQGNPVDARFQELVSRGDSGWRFALNGNNGNPSTAPYDLHFNP
ncbi:MAG TPA: LamG-like jellyroll fold domain-containing protein, partial [Verrucomicrobiae bacterium]|nr:LamG-like jellyroll fold domain-containing protein [Verrucomicrobiae bacterium]